MRTGRASSCEENFRKVEKVCALSRLHVVSGDNDNDNDTLREVQHLSDEGLALQARV